jgi:WD40 repeat protein
MAAWALEREMLDCETRIVSTRVSPDGKWLACACLDGKIRLFDFATAQLAASLEGDPERGSRGLRLEFTPDGQALTSAGSALRIWQPLPNANFVDLNLPDSPGGHAISRDGRLLAACCSGKIVLIDLASQQITQTIPVDDASLDVTFSPDGSLLAATVRKAALVFEPQSGTEVAKVNLGAQTNRVRFHPNQPWLIVCGTGKKSGMWNHATRKRLATYPVEEKAIWNLEVSPDGKTVAADTAHRIVLFDTESGEVKGTIERQYGWFLSLTFLADGRLLASDREKLLLYRE